MTHTHLHRIYSQTIGLFRRRDKCTHTHTPSIAIWALYSVMVIGWGFTVSELKLINLIALRPCERRSIIKDFRCNGRWESHGGLSPTWGGEKWQDEGLIPPSILILFFIRKSVTRIFAWCGIFYWESQGFYMISQTLGEKNVCNLLLRQGKKNRSFVPSWWGSRCKKRQARSLAVKHPRQKNTIRRSWPQQNWKKREKSRGEKTRSKKKKIWIEKERNRFWSETGPSTRGPLPSLLRALAFRPPWWRSTTTTSNDLCRMAFLGKL